MGLQGPGRLHIFGLTGNRPGQTFRQSSEHPGGSPGQSPESSCGEAGEITSLLSLNPCSVARVERREGTMVDLLVLAIAIAIFSAIFALTVHYDGARVRKATVESLAVHKEVAEC